MALPTLALCFLMISPTIFVAADLDPEGENVCLKTITYTEKPQKELKHKDLCKNGCSCGTDCSKGLCPAAVDANQKGITRSKIVPVCCDGYKEDSQGVKCLPICADGCGTGKCIAPEKCSCESGFFGPKCAQICHEGKWGENCKHDCNCSENAVCDRIVGCKCKPGWTGDKCANPCPKGYYGLQCMDKCNCDTTDFCDPITGTCIKPTTEALTTANFKQIEEPNPTPSDEKVQNNLDVDSVTVKEEIYRETTVHVSEIQENAAEKQVETASESFSSEVASLNDIIVNITKGEISAVENELFHSDSSGHTLENKAQQGPKGGNFIPTITVLSSAGFLILLIAGKWFIGKIQKNIKMSVTEPAPFDAEFPLIQNKELVFGNEPFYASYTKIERAPSLQTFKIETEFSPNKKPRPIYA